VYILKTTKTLSDEAVKQYQSVDLFPPLPKLGQLTSVDRESPWSKPMVTVCNLFSVLFICITLYTHQIPVVFRYLFVVTANLAVIARNMINNFKTLATYNTSSTTELQRSPLTVTHRYVDFKCWSAVSPHSTILRHNLFSVHFGS